MPAKPEQKAQSPGRYFVVVSVSSIWTYSPVSMMGVACDSGFVCACGIGASAKRKCLIFAAFAPNHFLYQMTVAAFAGADPL